MDNNQFTPERFPPWGLSWLTLALAILTIGTFIAVSGPGGGYITPMGTGVMMESGGSRAMPPVAGGMPMMDGGAPERGMYYPYPYPNPDVPVTDTREFLKTYYSAFMRSRDVPALTRRVETTVRGYGGRIDQESSSAQYGYVSFAVPGSKYGAFRAELESLVGSRFLTVSISSQNLLSQKVSIEEQQKQADTALADYQAARQKIVSAHAIAVQSLQKKIDADVEQLALLRAQAQTPQLLIQIQSVSDDLASLRRQLADENASYASKLNDADANITYAQDWQKAVQTQDQALLDTVATVTGTVSVQWISLWDSARLYLPGYWIPAIFAALTLLSYLRDRRRTRFSQTL